MLIELEKLAGIHQGPPKLYKDISKITTKIYAGHVLGWLERRFPHVQKLEDLKQELRKHTDNPKEYKSKKKVSIPVSLEGWKPIEGKNPPSRWNKLDVYFDFRGHSKSSARAFGYGAIEIDITLLPKTVKGFYQILDQLNEAIRHEVAHIGQYILKDTIGHGGMPSKKIEKEYDIKGLSRSEKHHLKNVEFYTDLGDAVDEYKARARHLDPKTRIDLAKYFVALTFFSPIKFKTKGQEFFQTLRKYDQNKWKKAVKEFFKAIEPELSEYFSSKETNVPGEMVEGKWSQERLISAINEFNRLMAIDPNSPEAKALLESLQRQEKYLKTTN